MNGFGLLVGHMVGDYIFQTSWQALNKVSSHIACAMHCTTYTLAVWLFSMSWMPLWGVLLCWVAHFPFDRWRLARHFMNFMGNESFATGPFAPWSVVCVDNTFHLVVLYIIGKLAGA